MLRTSIRSMTWSSGNGHDRMANAEGGPVGRSSLVIWHVTGSAAAQCRLNPVSKPDSSFRRMTEAQGESFCAVSTWHRGGPAVNGQSLHTRRRVLIKTLLRHR